MARRVAVAMSSLGLMLLAACGGGSTSDEARGLDGVGQSGAAVSVMPTAMASSPSALPEEPSAELPQPAASSAGKLAVDSARTQADSPSELPADLVAEAIPRPRLTWAQLLAQPNVPVHATRPRYSEPRISHLADVVAMEGDGGFLEALVLHADGRVDCRGFAEVCAAMPAKARSEAVAIGAGREHGMVLNGDGTVSVWGGINSWLPWTPMPNLTGVKVTNIAAGMAHFLAVTDTGRLHAWGYDKRGQADVPDALAGQRVKAVGAGWQHSLALTESGRVYAWGDNSYGQTSVPDSLSGRRVVRIAAGELSSSAITADGELVRWGQVAPDLSAVPAFDVRDVVQYADGNRQTMVILDDGTVRTWDTEKGTPGPLDTWIGVAAVCPCNGYQAVFTAAPGPIGSVAARPGRQGKSAAWVGLTWPKATQGAPANRYEVEVVGGEFDTWTALPDDDGDDTDLSAMISDLERGTSYKARVVAVNDAAAQVDQAVPVAFTTPVR